jgi:hypothetical protein
MPTKIKDVSKDILNQDIMKEKIVMRATWMIKKIRLS